MDHLRLTLADLERRRDEIDAAAAVIRGLLGEAQPAPAPVAPAAPTPVRTNGHAPHPAAERAPGYAPGPSPLAPTRCDDEPQESPRAGRVRPGPLRSRQEQAADRRRGILRHIKAMGPLRAARIGHDLNIPMGSLTAVLDHEWFHRESDGVHLTSEGEAELERVASAED